MWQISNGRIDRLVVFASRDGKAVPIGELTFQGAGRIRMSTFRYAKSWLEARGHGIDPTILPLRRAAYHSDPNKCEVPLPFLDATPDGWGRSILQAAFPEQHFGDGEFLAATGNERSGEIRIGHSPDAPPERWEPLNTRVMTIPDEDDTLEQLQAAAEAVDAGTATSRHLDLLFRKSGDLGGARPKTAIWRDGLPWIAKFRAQGDAFDDPRVEAVCLSLARACGIDVPGHEVISVSKRSVLLVRRFDREETGIRVGYSSAATMMGVTNTGYSTNETYVSLATKARQSGVAPCEAELFRRMLFNCFIHNTDDHLRNHGFLRDGSGWHLSPAFDLVPDRKERLVLAPAQGILPLPDPLVTFASYPAFGLSRQGALGIYGQIADGMAAVRDTLDAYEVSRIDREVLAPRWAKVYSPPAQSALPGSPLVRPSRSPGEDVIGRLAELGVGFDQATHEAKKTGRGITIRRKDTGHIDNAPRSPARIRDAWTTSPRMEFFQDGSPVTPPEPDIPTTQTKRDGHTGP
jgi:serine/threonine-protein kinase HipA